MLSRPVLKPALRRLWRGPDTLQLGIDARHAVVLAGVDGRDAALLDLLDGAHEPAELTLAAERSGAPSRGEELLAVLTAAGALDDTSTLVAATRSPRLEPDLLTLSLRHRAPGGAAAVLAQRQATEIEVLGAGRLGATLAALLAAAGVGRVTAVDGDGVRSADLAPGGLRDVATARSRGELVSALTAAVAPDNRVVAPTRSVVVLAPPGPAVPPEWLRLVRHRPHLPVLIRELTASIGPLVLPGRSACLRCVELARADRDPQWPVVAAQLVAGSRGVEPCDITLAAAAASLAAMHLLSWLDLPDAPAPTIGGVIELSLADLRLRRHAAHGHPGCGCGADQPARASEEAARTPAVLTPAGPAPAAARPARPDAEPR
jgi:bacteriocin biosynthesis cyclodehydratase domain-containing protein